MTGPVLNATRPEGIVSYSRKVFVPVTRLCRDVCHYCTFARSPREVGSPYLSVTDVLESAKSGKRAGCKELLFTLGDKPELRYRTARDALAILGFDTTLKYVEYLASRVFEDTGLLPHINAGVMSRGEMASLKKVSVSQGLMLESSADRLCLRGGPHFGSPDKLPSKRLENIRFAGELSIPFTTGLLIGIGESRSERLEALEALAELHAQYGHIQEVIIQSFRAKPRTPMSNHSEPDIEELVWTIRLARDVFGSEMPLQCPPNLSSGHLQKVLDAGIDDWGGVSPVTPDYVNPEAPWPHIDRLRAETAAAGKTLTERLAVYPKYLTPGSKWVDERFFSAILPLVDGAGYVREDDWYPGISTTIPYSVQQPARNSTSPRKTSTSQWLDMAIRGVELPASAIVGLFKARSTEFQDICFAAHELRERVSGEDVTYVVNRNINYTNVCYFKCGFCGFSKGNHAQHMRGKSYNLSLDEIANLAVEALNKNATEVCLQGGIHPRFTGDTYLNICRAINEAAPSLHIHAFSPLEIWQGAQTLGIRVPAFLEQLQRAGLRSLPGTAAEVLVDSVRKQICPDKISSGQWIDVVATAHEVGLKTTSTIMFGHLDSYEHWAEHLLRLRRLQEQTGGITEFVPLPFVHAQTPLNTKNMVRHGPTYREAVLMHSIARLVLYPRINNIQTSWVKMGIDGARNCLNAGCNDLGGTLMNESITRAAGGEHGQELDPSRMHDIADSIGRKARQRTTLYGAPIAIDPDTMRRDNHLLTMAEPSAAPPA